MINNIYGTTGTQAQVAQLTPATPNNTTAGLSFGDVLDAVNPLQHIPVVSGLYRAISGSSISAVSQLAGDTLYGGLIGGAAIAFASSLANVAVQQVSGEDISQHVVATVNAAAAAVTSSTAPVTAKLTPDSTMPPVINANNDVATQAATAVQTMLHQGLHPEHTNGEYQRAQAYDAVNKKLSKIII